MKRIDEPKIALQVQTLENSLFMMRGYVIFAYGRYKIPFPTDSVMACNPNSPIQNSNIVSFLPLVRCAVVRKASQRLLYRAAENEVTDESVAQMSSRASRQKRNDWFCDKRTAQDK